MEALKKILTYIEEHADVRHVENTIVLQTRVNSFLPVDRICMCVHLPDHTFPPYAMEETHEDMAKMMYNELIACIPRVKLKDDAIPTIRANYGVGTLASLFGAKSSIVNGNMPWVTPLSKEEIKRVVDRGVPDLDSGFGARLVQTYAFYNEVLKDYPACRKILKLYHPDLQGPFDTAHLIYGSDIYPDLYDEPELIHALLSVVTETYIRLFQRMYPYLSNDQEGSCYHWDMLYPGNTVIRNDSAVNLSCAMYQEFAQQYDKKIIDALGGASMHFCGRADHWIFDMAENGNLKGLNFGYMENLIFGQEYLDFLFDKVTAAKLPIVHYILTRNEFDAMDFPRYRTGISFCCAVGSEEDAKRLLELCKEKIK